MHILGLQGMSRRYDTYAEGFGFEFWNMVSTIGAFVLAFSILTFIVNVLRSHRSRHLQPPCGPDPWDARSLEWSIPSPAPEHNFDVIPTIVSLDDWWHRKYGHDEDGKVVRLAYPEEIAQKGDATGVHLPAPSYWPIVLAAGLPIVGFGLIFNLWLCIVGGLVVVGAIFGWAMEPVDDPNAGHGHDDHGHDDHGPSDPPAGELAAVGAEEGAH
jgi:cytochrome c oxidase subunit 1